MGHMRLATWCATLASIMVVTTLTTQSAYAGLLKYTYTGNPYDNFLSIPPDAGDLSPFSASSKVTGEVIVNVGTGPITGDGYFDAVFLSLTDGITTYSGPPLPGDYGRINIDSNYHIYGWSVVASAGNYPSAPFTSVETSTGGDGSESAYVIGDNIFGASTNTPGTWSGPTTLSLPATPPSTLFTPQQKIYYGNVANLADVVGTITGLFTFTKGVLKGTEGAIEGVLDYYGLLSSSPAAKKLVADQVLQNGNLAIAGGFVGFNCTVESEAIAPCAAALVALDLTVLSDLASAIKVDPPDLNYQSVFLPTIESSPVSLTNACSGGLATVAYATPYALDQTDEWLNALYVTNNRYQTALAEGDLARATLQYAVFQNYLASYAAAAATAGADLNCFSTDLSTAGLGSDLPTTQDETNALSFLQTQDPSSLDSLLGPYGFTDTEITTLVDDAAADPPALATETMVEGLADLGQALTPSPTSVPEPNSFELLVSAIVGLMIALIIVRSRQSIQINQSRAGGLNNKNMP